jgi:hypothetical protein
MLNIWKNKINRLIIISNGMYYKKNAKILRLYKIIKKIIRIYLEISYIINKLKININI